MYKIGEFAQTAQVSGRLLRYYDSIGLLSPVRIDPVTGYRYYAAHQLADLNRILALKQLGLILDQVGRLLRDGVSAEEIRGMFALRRAELECSLSEEAVVFHYLGRRIEARFPKLNAYFCRHIDSPALQAALAAERPFVEQMALDRSFIH